ncbi:MAG TPA: cytochrome b6-f complex iron-sulfur subunit [Chlorobaculum sp.]|jgi:cytochrome b6-f complex iron-sulfur subunit|uniref:Cytochrome b6-f complex iron-sulfur subunit n=1 Tax=Chlorobaculum tepidum (strain ATCC 49652 / DSM 12025 / NBRC 103806 / TLS) TaxID=194439 RepID=UCRI_CHLTE|nr:Rieske 2Fe-2S domain-containing protein [Chlorobaculum tepidum]Q9F722.4 RecName: Full=Cytochrome b6-f complex iron-sulfur subunit; AltName: Full=Plastohydroquinone:plastocyanin oxidoreductase iron-sulfur protein; AltName: Full=Rieske iron-sulfur protein; Short=ISP; Short=RISP [Chlorobaculum tepidum TLS]AAM71548.1 cytochrome b6-f complex, iron-sulfur subunit [Chlorobaculum tepidum TLS]HBU23775.1 cytochrome b6-f complex iron-sulfur subunit [Chlorobaculum sp.]
MAQTGNFKSPARMSSLGQGAAPASAGAVTGGKPREEGLKGVDFERRGFLQKIVGGVGAVVAVSTLYPVVRYIVPPAKKIKIVNELAVGPASDVPNGTGKIYQFNDDKVIVVNHGGSLTAVSAICTHLGCLVHWDEAADMIACPCHGAKYTQDGKIISGPQPLPLKQYKVKIEDGKIVVSIA